jgi:hypothetical protein
VLHWLYRIKASSDPEYRANQNRRILAPLIVALDYRRYRVIAHHVVPLFSERMKALVPGADKLPTFQGHPPVSLAGPLSAVQMLT